ncbi:MAG: energy transducer TonB [Pseudomonadota bacterium]
MFTSTRRLIAGFALALGAVASFGNAYAADAPADKVVYVSPHTTDEPFRSYYAAFFNRLVAASAFDAPRGFNGQPMDGSVLVVVTIAASGATERIDVVESSSPIVEKHALTLIRKVQPFAPFSAEMRGKAAKVVITSHLNYASER